MSLVPKLSEVQELLMREIVQIGCIVESWLKHHISDSVVNIEGYNLVRKDRLSCDHGGICIYIKEDIKYQLVENLTCCVDHEIICHRMSRHFLHNLIFSQVIDKSIHLKILVNFEEALC